LSEFSSLGLSPALTDRLTALGLIDPTPIQTRAIPPALEGRDVLGLAQTGTGKTMAFGLPLIERLMAEPGKPNPKSAKALILAPTRELVNQIAENLARLTEGTRIRVLTVVGGQSVNRQVTMLARGTDILVATPGRLIDHLDNRAVDLRQAKFLVLDEADQMLDMGFIHALRKIAPRLATPRQTMLFSATMPPQLEELSQSYLSNPVRVQVTPPGKAADKVTQSVHFLDKGEKPSRLRDILSKDLEALTLVFARTKHGAEKLMKGLVDDGFNAASIHGNKSQGQRDRAIAGFREGKITVLVATDVAARGIDIPGVAYVINYELPEVPENYVHRIGRTARAGREGEAIAFCAADEVDRLKAIQKLMKIEIPVASGDMPAAIAPERSGRPPGQRRGGGKPQGHGHGKPKGQRGNGGGNGGGKPGEAKGRPQQRRRRRPAAV